jgi:hypothetical protein
MEAGFRPGNGLEIFEMFGISRDDVPAFSKQSVFKGVQKIVDHPHAWIIEAAEAFIGETRLDRVDLHDCRASMAVGICDRTALGRGFGSEAISRCSGMPSAPCGFIVSVFAC